MQHVEHILDKYIQVTKHCLTALPDDHPHVEDTTLLQLQCLEKFANFQGYRIDNGLFISDNPAYRVITLNNIVALYNNTMKAMGDQLKDLGFIERVYLSGRNLRNRVVVMQHKVKFL